MVINGAFVGSRSSVASLLDTLQLSRGPSFGLHDNVRPFGLWEIRISQKFLLRFIALFRSLTGLISLVLQSMDQTSILLIASPSGLTKYWTNRNSRRRSCGATPPQKLLKGYDDLWDVIYHCLLEEDSGTRRKQRCSTQSFDRPGEIITRISLRADLLILIFRLGIHSALPTSLMPQLKRVQLLRPEKLIKTIDMHDDNLSLTDCTQTANSTPDI